jgi:hypothetical protein
MVVCIDPNPSKIKGDGFFWDLGTAATRGPLLRNSFLTVGSGERNDYLPGKQPTIAARGVCSAGGPTSVGSGPQDVSPALRSRAQNYGRRAVAAGGPAPAARKASASGKIRTKRKLTRRGHDARPRAGGTPALPPRIRLALLRRAPGCRRPSLRKAGSGCKLRDR